VLCRRDVGLVEYLDRHRIALVDQRRKADEAGAPFAISISSGSSPKVQAVWRWSAGVAFAPSLFEGKVGMGLAVVAEGEGKEAPFMQPMPETPSCLRAQFGLQCSQVAPHALLAAVLVHHAANS
jgi:hypothetical protein